MKVIEVVEGQTEFYVNKKFGYEVVRFFNYGLDKDSCLLRTDHLFSSLHVLDGEIVDMDGRKYKMRNSYQLSLFGDLYEVS